MKSNKIWGFLVGAVVSFSAHANECYSYLVPPETKVVRASVREELDQFKNRTLDKVVRIIRGDKSVEAKKDLIVNTLKTNFYFESTIPVFVMENLADNWLTSRPRPNGWKVLADIKAEITRRRTVHWRGMADLNSKYIESLSIKDVVQKKLKLVRKQSEYEIYSLGPINTIKEMLSYVVAMVNIWPRPFHFNPMAPVRVLQLEIGQLPGVYIYFFHDYVTMNWAFQRPSMQIERNLWPIRGDDLYGTVAGGHDLKGSDLLNYISLAEQELKKDLNASIDYSYRRRLHLEREFLATEVQPKVLASADSEVVFLAFGSMHATLSTLSHEVWHGVYFTNPTFANWCRDYWARLTQSDRDLFMEMASGFGYKLAEDQDHAANEFQAFMLELDAESPPSAQEKKRKEVLAKLRPAFLKAFSATPFARLLE